MATSGVAMRDTPGDLSRVREAGKVADVACVGDDTGGLIWLDAKADGGRTSNDSGDHGLREAGESADNTSSDAAGSADTNATANLVADTDDVANDDVKETRGLHNADEEQNAGHVGNHRVETRDDHLGDGHALTTRKRKTGHDGRNGRTRNGGHVNGRAARNHQYERCQHYELGYGLKSHMR